MSNSTKDVLKSLGSDLLDYYGIWPWLKRRVSQLLTPTSKRTFESVSAFWQAAINDELVPGQIVHFKNAFLTEWVPRQPGALWGNHEAFSRLSERSFGTRYLVEQRTDIDPIGVIRYPTTGQNAELTCLGLTTADAWWCDLGLPVVVSRAVANEFYRNSGAARVVEADISGQLQFGSPWLLASEHLRSHGSRVDAAVLEAIKRPSRVPICSLHLDSVLDISMRLHDSHPPGYLWALQRVLTVSYTSASLDPENRVRIETIHHEPLWEYRFETACLDLREKSEIDNFVAIAKEGGREKDRFPPRPKREEGVTDVQVLTEFDARIGYFDNPIRISVDPTSENRDTRLLEECLLDLATKVRTLDE